MMGPLPSGACGVRILGTGSAVPDRRLTNDDFARMMDTSDEWITQRTGIKERRVLDLRTEGCSTLAQRARALIAIADPSHREGLERAAALRG